MNPYPNTIHFDNAGMIDGVRHIILTRSFTAITSLGRVTAHRGFICNGASIPRIAQGIVGHPFDVFLEDAVIHDFLYSPYNDEYYRDEADYIFKELMWNRRNEISAFKRESLFLAVKLFGWRYFNGQPPHL